MPSNEALGLAVRAIWHVADSASEERKPLCLDELRRSLVRALEARKVRPYAAPITSHNALRLIAALALLDRLTQR